VSVHPYGHADTGFTVNSYLTVDAGQPRTPRPRRRNPRPVENDAYTAFCRRIIAAAGRRIAAGDVEGLPDLLALADELDKATADAVHGLREFGYSWAQIASRLGTSRQAAQQRWGGDCE